MSQQEIQWMYFEEFQEKVLRWAYDRNLLEGSTPKDQFHKLVQEVAELSDSICKGKCPKDDIGDCFVVLIIMCEQLGLHIEECFAKAWNDIKDRKGKMVDGVFIKEQDYVN